MRGAAEPRRHRSPGRLADEAVRRRHRRRAGRAGPGPGFPGRARTRGAGSAGDDLATHSGAFRKPKAESRKPKAESRKPKAESPKRGVDAMSELTTGQRPESKPVQDERDTLLSVAAHEIRTPLASLRLYLDAVIKAADRGSLDAADVGVRLRKARRQCDRLNVLLNDLIDIARAPARPVTVPPEPVDIVATVGAVCDRLREQFSADGWNPEVVAAEPLLGAWDRTRLEQMVANLVSSAHKRAPSAPVRVEVNATDGNRVAL